ncbi:MAG: hypothetical protein KDK61_08445, partial [Simkania sp.]|nr:hypothetical protein [Simkania sp.]
MTEKTKVILLGNRNNLSKTKAVLPGFFEAVSVECVSNVSSDAQALPSPENSLCFDQNSATEGKETALKLLKNLALLSNDLLVLDFSDFEIDSHLSPNAAQEKAGNFAFYQTLIQSQDSKSAKSAKRKLFHFTQGLQAFQNEKVQLSGAITASLFRVLGAEYRQVLCRTIDFDSQDELPKIVEQEIGWEQDESEVCYRKQ